MEPRFKVLAIDDNNDNLTVLRAVMKDYLPDAKVLTATSGKEGLALARSEDPDVALLDISMPSMDGFEVCRQLKSDEALSTIPVVFLTALRTDPGARVRALEEGAEGFLVQPVEEYALLAQVRAMAKLKAANVRQRREKEALADLVEERTRELQAHVTELQRMQREQQELQATLAQSDRLMNMGLLAASVAHEINNPLSFVLHNVGTLAEELPQMASSLHRCHAALEQALGSEGMARALGDGPQLGPGFIDDAVARLKEAHVGTERIRRITRGLSTFSRVEGTPPEPVDVQVSVEHALTLAMNEIKHRAQVVKELGPVSPVLASEGKLAQVLLNLLVNAAHAIAEGAPERNQIRVRAWDEGGSVFIEVADSGKGIAPEHRAQVFEPFFTTKGVGFGSGLGLWISRNIIVELGGELTFESEVGKGTRFRVKLPALSPDAMTVRVATAPAATATAAVAPVRGRVLVIDDEPGLRGLLTRIIGPEHEVVTAASGVDAKRLLAGSPPFDVILCDLMMPEVSGTDVHAWLAARDPMQAKRLVFITGGAFSRAAVGYLDRVTNPRIEKPFDAATIRALVGRLVRQARAGPARA